MTATPEVISVVGIRHVDKQSREQAMASFMASLRNRPGMEDESSRDKGINASIEDEQEMALAQQIAVRMERFRPANATIDIHSEPMLADGSGMKRSYSKATIAVAAPSPDAATAVAVGEGEEKGPQPSDGNAANDAAAEEDTQAAFGTDEEIPVVEVQESSRPDSRDTPQRLHSPDQSGALLEEDADEFVKGGGSSSNRTEQMKALHAANAASIVGREAHFVPYNPWGDDAVHLERHKQFASSQMLLPSGSPSMLRPPSQSETPTEKAMDDALEHKRLERGAFQSENFATLRYYDVQGFNFQKPSRRMDPQQTALFHSEEDTVCYMTGHHITRRGIFDRAHRTMILKKEDALHITAFVASQDGKYIATAERLADCPRVTLYRADNCMEITVLDYQYVAKGYIYAMAMATNNKFLVSCSTSPNDARVIVWGLDDTRVVMNMEISSKLMGGTPEAVLFNPWLSTRFTLLSREKVSMWNTEDRGRNIVPVVTGDIPAILAKFGSLNDMMIRCSFDDASSPNVNSSAATSTSKGATTGVRLLQRQQSSSTPTSNASAAALQQKSSRHLRPTNVFTSHCWFDEDCLAVLTADGCIASYDHEQLVALSRVYVPPSLLFAAAKAKENEGDLGQTNNGGDTSHGPSRAASTKLSSTSLSRSLIPSLTSSKTITSRQSTEDGTVKLSYFDHLVWVSRGLLVAGPMTCLVLLDRTYDERYFQQVAVFSCFHASPETRILSMSVSPGEENLVVALSNNTMEVAILAELDDVLGEFTDDVKEGEPTQEATVSKSKRKGRCSSKGSVLEVAETVIGSDSRQLLAKVRQTAIERLHHRDGSHSGTTHADDAMEDESGEAVREIHTKKGGVASVDDEKTLLALASMKKRRQYEELRVPTDTIPDGEPFGIVVTGDPLLTPMHHVSLHHQTITKIAIATQLPYVVSSSLDRSLRVYNIASRSVVAMRIFEEEILSCDIHPTGLYVVVSLEFFAKCYLVLDQQFLKVAEMEVRNCHEVVYSKSGHLLAFSIGNKVSIYDAHQYVQLGQLIGHTMMIKSVSWSNSDTRITTADMIGTVCCWNSSTFLRDGTDASQNSLVMQTARFHEDTELIAGVGCNKHANSLVFEGEFTIVCASPNNPSAVVLLRPGIIMPKSMSSRKLHTQLIAFGRVSQTLFVGTPTGRILFYTWPVLRTSKPYDYIDAHASEILFLVLSPDERFLFSVGADGLMFSFHLEQMRGGRYISATAFNYHLFDDLHFGLRSSLDSYSRDAAALRLLAAEFRAQTKEALAQITARETATLESIRDRGQRELVQLKKRLEILKSEKSKLDKQTIQEGHAVEESYNEAAESLETLYAKVQEETLLRYQQLEFEKDEVSIRYESTVAKRESQYQVELQEMERTRQDREQSLLQEIRKLEERERKRSITVDAMLCQSVVEFEHELIDAENQQKQSIRRNEDLVLRAMLTASVGDREVDRLKKDCAAIMTQLDVRRNTIKDLQSLLDRRHKETLELKQGMVAKQEAINVAERKMQHMKHQLTALENLRFVLTHQFETLEADVQPKDDTIADLEEQVVEMESNLNEVDEQRCTYRAEANALTNNMKALETEQHKVRGVHMTVSRKLDVVLSEVSTVVANFRDPLQFAVTLKKTVDRCRSKNHLDGEEEIVSVMPQQVALVKELDELKTRMQLQAQHANDIPRQRQAIITAANTSCIEENTALIKEAKLLRQQKRELQQRVASNENALRDIRTALHLIAAKNRALLLTEGPSNAETSSALLPIASPSSLLSDQSSVVASPSPIPATTTTPATTKKRALGRGSPSPSLAGGPRRLLPPLSRTGGTTEPPRSSSAEPLTTWGGQPLKKKPNSAERAKEDQRQHLQSLLATLDENTEHMMHHKQTITDLRQCAQELLRLEEQRLLRMLAQTSLHPTNGAPMNHSDTTGDASSNVDTTTAAVLEEPDWVVRSGATPAGKGERSSSLSS